MASYGFMCAFGANSTWGKLNIRSVWPKGLRVDCIADDNSGQMGADALAESVLLMCLVYHRYWALTMIVGALDVAYYGP